MLQGYQGHRAACVFLLPASQHDYILMPQDKVINRRTFKKEMIEQAKRIPT